MSPSRSNLGHCAAPFSLTLVLTAYCLRLLPVVPMTPDNAGPTASSSVMTQIAHGFPAAGEAETWLRDQDDRMFWLPLQGLLSKRWQKRLDWPHLLNHPFVRLTQEERAKQQAAMAECEAQARQPWPDSGPARSSGGNAGAQLPACLAVGFEARLCDICCQHSCKGLFAILESLACGGDS